MNKRIKLASVIGIFSLLILAVQWFVGGFGKWLVDIWPCTTQSHNTMNCFDKYDTYIIAALCTIVVAVSLYTISNLLTSKK